MQTPIIDAHHHIWRRSDLPWLDGPMVPRIFGPYEAIRRDYPMSEYLDDIAESGVVKSVYVQTNWPPEKAEEEVAWVESVADETGWPHAIVGYVDLMADDARSMVARLARYPRLRGIRMQLHWHENPQYRFARQPDLAAHPAFRRNFAAIANHGLSFDLQVFDHQMGAAARLAEEFPETTFILQHAGMLENLSDKGRAAWRGGMAELAERPNVVAKVSGLGTFIHRNDADHIAWIVDETVALFGTRRCLFGSNFPIEKLWTDYGSLAGAYRAAAARHPGAEQAMLHDVAARVYRLH